MSYTQHREGGRREVCCIGGREEGRAVCFMGGLQGRAALASGGGV